jgi:hypothetical protein
MQDKKEWVLAGWLICRTALGFSVAFTVGGKRQDKEDWDTGWQFIWEG